MVSVLGNSLWNTSYVVFLASNNHTALAIRFLIAAAGSLAAACVLVPALEVRGAAVSMVVMDLIVAPYVLRKALVLLEDDYRTYARDVLTAESARTHIRKRIQ
jgi:hypothetical protein